MARAATAKRKGPKVKVVRLPGGDVVTAGLVRLDNDPIAPHWNVGLVRTSPGGVRQVWSGSGPYFHAGNQYVVYPNLVNGGSGIATIRKIADFAYANGRLYVLVRSRFSADPPDHDANDDHGGHGMDDGPDHDAGDDHGRRRGRA